MDCDSSSLSITAAVLGATWTMVGAYIIITCCLMRAMEWNSEYQSRSKPTAVVVDDPDQARVLIPDDLSPRISALSELRLRRTRGPQYTSHPAPIDERGTGPARFA
jgi:hypothetical protein